MTGIEVTALALVGAWLGLLTIVLVLTIRQIALLTSRLDTSHSVALDALDHDGLEIGSRLPDEVVESFPLLADGTTFILLLASTCGTCRKVASDLGTRSFDERLVALVPGPEEMAEALISELPLGAMPVQDPLAREIAQKLHLESTPFAFQVDDGKVTGKAYLHSDQDFIDLVTFEKRMLTEAPSGTGG